jgi:integrase
MIRFYEPSLWIIAKLQAPESGLAPRAAKLDKIGMGWANFLVMRRTHATLMNELGFSGKLIADQLGHSLDVNQNVYTQTPVENRLPAVNQLEKSLFLM